MTDNEIIKSLNYCCGNIKNNDEECNEDMCYQVTLPESRDEGTRYCYTYSDICGYQSTVVDVNQIDNIVKEMT